MRLGIDASNIRDGGGITHLAAILAAVEPKAHGVARVVVWASRATLMRLPARKWLAPIAQEPLEGALGARVAWQRFALPRLAAKDADLLWVPGGSFAGRFHPFVTMCRNMLPFEPHERRRYGLSWMRLRLTLLARSQASTFRRADGVIFLTDYARRTVVERLGSAPRNAVTIPHGVDDRFRRAPRTQYPLDHFSPAKPFRLVAVSIVDVYKHPWALVEAVGRLRLEGFPVSLDLIGSAYPPSLRRLRDACERFDPEGRAIRYRGKIAFEELHSAYHEADGFVFASSCENMPNILLEAMASGLPIACSDRGPMPELLGPGGVYFDPENVESVSRAIRRMIESEELRARIAASAHARAETYGWDRCAEETMRFLGAVWRSQGRETIPKGGEVAESQRRPPARGGGARTRP